MIDSVLLDKTGLFHAIVPIKQLSRCKSRLSGTINMQKRRALALAMFRDVLTVLVKSSDVARVSILTEDRSSFVSKIPDIVQIIEEKKFCSGKTGLNCALGSASIAITADRDEHILIVHGDLPLFSNNDVRLALQSLSKGNDIVFGADRGNIGTNLVAFRSGVRPEFFFGVESLKSHMDWARESQLSFSCITSPGIGFDIDTKVDLKDLVVSLDYGSVGKETAKLLTKNFVFDC